MQIFDASTAQCWVRVYREGVAAAVGHDLLLGVGTFTVEVDAQTPKIRASFQAESLRVLGTQTDGGAPGEVSARDRSKIEQNLRQKVLETHRFAVISFESTAVSLPQGADEAEVRGRLSLHGVAREIRVAVELGAAQSVARARLHQPDFAITPFRALMGALKVRADVDIELRLPLGKDAIRRVAGGGG